MRCNRCGSLMAEEIYYHQGDTFAGRRCVMCGEVVDPEILKNRAESLAVKEMEEKVVSFQGVGFGRNLRQPKLFSGIKSLGARFTASG